jgi:hypothetical protein
MKASSAVAGRHYRWLVNGRGTPTPPLRVGNDGDALWRAIVDLPHSLYEQDLLRLPGRRAEWQRIVHP